jgi:large repetitive protein
MCSNAPRRRSPIQAWSSAALVLLLAAVAALAEADSLLGEWRTVVAGPGHPTARDEACFVMVRGKAYLIGGRGTHPTDVFDPARKSWASKSGPPQEISHMQCVAYNGSVYIAGGWHGSFPYEKNNNEMFVYDVAADAWSMRPYLPNNPERRRGAAAFVLGYDGKMYLVAGNIGGHGNHSVAQALFDV